MMVRPVKTLRIAASVEGWHWATEGQKVAVHRNLHTGGLTVLSREVDRYGRKLCEADAVYLVGCYAPGRGKAADRVRLTVRESGWRLAREGAGRTVHAFLEGRLRLILPSTQTSTRGDDAIRAVEGLGMVGSERLRYNPLEADAPHWQGENGQAGHWARAIGVACNGFALASDLS